MKRTHILLLTILLLAGQAALAQSAVDVNQLTAELQKDSPRKDDLTLVWWIPRDYWGAILENEKLSKAQIEEFLGIVRPYNVVAVFDGKIGSDGAVTYRPESEIRASIKILDAAGNEYGPLSQANIGPGMKSMLDIIRPLIANALGKTGANFHFLVFPGLNSSNELLADARKAGMFRVRLEKGREFSWKLPLSSLMPAKKCPIDGEKMNGDWRFCPWHGVELKN